MAESGLEVKPHTSPEVAPQPDGNMYYTSGGSNQSVVEQSDQSNQSQAKSQDRFRAVCVLAVIAVVCLALALGAGLGAGLAAKHKSSSSSDTPIIGTKASNAPVTMMQASNTPVTIIQSDNAPTTITQSGEITTITPTPVKIPSPGCPAANGSTYTATNKPLPTIDPQWYLQIPETSLSFEILCYTNFVEGPTNVQIFTNVSSLNECLDECALYNFRTDMSSFPALGCTGIAFGNAWQLCFLKSNVTPGTQNETSTLPGYDGAVLLGF